MVESSFDQQLPAGRFAPWSVARVCLAVLLIDAVLVIALLLMGNSLLPRTVPLEWWGDDFSPLHNSQHVSDYFSFSHFISGMGLFLALAFALPDFPVSFRFVPAVASSAIWEIVENTPQMISIFNGVDGYRGDSIVNSLSDTAFAALGFAAAATIPAGLSVAGAVLIEVAMSVLVQNGLVLMALKTLG